MAALTDAVQQETPTLLRRTELRKFLSPAQLEELPRFGRAAMRRIGSTVFRQDERADQVYFMMEGTVELRARPPGRRVYRTVEVVGSGCIFGEESLFGEARYLSSARILDGAHVMALPVSSFDRILEARREMAIGIMRCAGSCLVETVRRSAILTQAPADVALKQLLQELAESPDNAPGRPTKIRVTHAQLAGVLHLSRETVSRLLARMAAEGSVEIGRGLITVSA
jgi:CRP-like cAMP-binding protein